MKWCLLTNHQASVGLAKVVMPEVPDNNKSLKSSSSGKNGPQDAVRSSNLQVKEIKSMGVGEKQLTHLHASIVLNIGKIQIEGRSTFPYWLRSLPSTSDWNARVRFAKKRLVIKAQASYSH